MRTTVTIDPDVEELLRQATQNSRQSFKKALNDGLRRGLAHLAPDSSPDPFVVEARPMGLRPGLDPARLHEVANDLEAEAFAITTRKLREQLEK
ncbi:MAG: antitoxin [Synoicihabitans sp.]